ncbi:MAG: deoxyribonuclease V [Alphaproteobacteria bacterium]|nr:deoxyribonuclease V [Alphaproteobacteria bacterium]
MTWLPSDIYTHPANAAEAIAQQNALREKLRIEDDFSALHTILGVDVGYDIQNNTSGASIVLMRLPSLEQITTLKVSTPTLFPYISGLLSFREIPAILAALEQLEHKPDLLMVDGQGIAHPRRMGIAAHLGVMIDIPSIGVAKSRLCGNYNEPDLIKGAQTPLFHRNEHVGTVLRSRDNVKPLFVSPGHRISIQSATKLVQQCLTRYRLPEPVRQADKISKFRK